MRIVLFSVFCLPALFVQAQPKNVHITASIKGMEAGKTIYLVNDRNYTDSTTSFAGGFRLDTYIAPGAGNSYTLQAGRRPEYTDTRLPLYLEKGTIHIKGNGPLFRNVTLSGDPFVNDLNRYNLLVRPADRQMEMIYKRQDSARRAGNTEALQQLSVALRQADSLKRVRAGQWVETHRSSPISTYLIATQYFYSGINKQEPIFKKLLPAAKENALAARLQEQVNINDLNGIGKTAPAFAQRDTSGRQVALSDFKGKYVLLDFWASWCVPCRQETPFLKEAIRRYGNKNFTIVSVSIDTDTAKWMKAVRKDQMNWTNLVDPGTNRIDGVLHGYYLPTVPTNLLIDPNGIIIARNLRGEALCKKLSGIL